MWFKRTVQRYGQAPEPVTPYQKAEAVWDSRVGSIAVQAANWRLMAFGASAIALVLAGGLTWVSSQSRVTPYVVEIEGEGAVRSVQPADAVYKPSDAQIAWYLGRFITDVRALSTDPVLVRQNWLEAYAFATGDAVTFLNSQAQGKDPFADIGQRSVTVSITSIVRASPTTFQVKWQEQAFEHGAPAGSRLWTAILTVQQSLPKRADVLRKNPLGLYVTDLAWSEEYPAPQAGHVAVPSVIP
jgi:type IV secretion system protein VirB5